MERAKLEDLLRELEYSIEFKVKNLHPGRWPAARGSGEGYSFEKFERLSNRPDLRRIDLLATRRNPLMNEPLVRMFKQTSRIDVIMLADLSPSLLCGFSEPKLIQVAKLATLFGYTAFRFGDRFGFIGFDKGLVPEFVYPAVRSSSLGLEIGERLLDFRPAASRGGPAMDLDLKRVLPEKKALIIFVSDFYLDPRVLRNMLAGLRRHAVLPVMLRQAWERTWPSGLFGVLKMKDPEREGERAVLFTPRTIRRFNRRARENEKKINQAFRSFSTVPIVLDKVTPGRFLEELEKAGG